MDAVKRVAPIPLDLHVIDLDGGLRPRAPMSRGCNSRTSFPSPSSPFEGSAADDLRRARRAKAIASILASLGFAVEVKRDRVGRLLQFTRQMDILLEDEAGLKAVTRAFLNEDGALEDLPPKEDLISPLPCPSLLDQQGIDGNLGFY